MNKFEQEAEEIIEREQRYDTGLIVECTNDRICSAISNLHDKEMIDFAEWVWNMCELTLSGWISPCGTLCNTTSELLTIFREENK